MSTHRYVCDVLTEMRTAVRVGRIDMLKGLIEEVQSMANRMEAQLYTYRDMRYNLEDANSLEKTIADLKARAEIIEGVLQKHEK